MPTRADDETWLDELIELRLSRQDVILIESLLWRVQETPVAEYLVRDHAYARMLNAALARLIAPAAAVRDEMSRRLEEVGIEVDNNSGEK